MITQLAYMIIIFNQKKSKKMIRDHQGFKLKVMIRDH